MSLTKVKESVVEMSVDERLELAAFIAHLNLVDDSGYRAELDRRMTAMDAGRKIPARTLEELHEELSRNGR